MLDAYEERRIKKLEAQLKDLERIIAEIKREPKIINNYHYTYYPQTPVYTQPIYPGYSPYTYEIMSNTNVN